MKRPVALILTIAIFAAIAVCFLRPVSYPNPDFGYADRVFVLPDVSSVDVFGDTHVMTATYVETDGAYIRVSFKPADGSEILLGSAVYANGTTNAVEKYHYGYIEKFEDGKWRFYDRLHTREASSFSGENGPNVISKSYLQPFLFPFHDPGRYRVNFYFREYQRDVDRTGDNLYTISFESEVAPASGSRFDVCSLGMGAGKSGVVAISFILRANKGETPYLDLSSAQIKRLDDDVDVSVAWGYMRSTEILYFFEKLNGCMDAPLVSEYLLYFSEPVPAGEYAVSMTFAEHPDGSGERYMLTLNLRFDE